MDRPFEFVGIDHVALNVMNLDRMTSFYCGVLGCKEVLRQERVGLIHLRAGNTLIDLIDCSGPLGGELGLGTGNLNHLCLRVVGFDAEATRNYLKALGAEVGELRERFGYDGNASTLYLTDPEGNGVELRPVEGSYAGDPESAAT